MVVQKFSIAIDPGYDRLGIAVFEGKALVHSECFIPPKGDLVDRLLAVHDRARLMVQEFKPESLAIETLFFNKNQKTAIAVAEARGAIIVAARAEGVEVVEYSPQSVKIAVTGTGNAGKDAVIRMVERLLRLPEKKRFDDEYDAIALGLCHVHHNPHAWGLHGK